MASNPREWSVPAPVRALLWWPAISFALVIVAPDTAPVTIVAAGALLVVIGGLVAAGAERLRQMRAEAVAPAAAPTAFLEPATATSAPSADPHADAPTTEFPTIDLSLVEERTGADRAA